MILSCCQSRTRPLKRSTASWKPVKNAPRWRLSSILQPASFDTLMPRTLATASVGRLLHHAHLARPARPSPDAAIIDHQSDRRRRQRTTASHALPTPRYAFVAQETCCGMVATSTHRSPPNPSTPSSCSITMTRQHASHHRSLRSPWDQHSLIEHSQTKKACIQQGWKGL